MSVLVQNLRETFPEVYCFDDLEAALDEITRFDHCQVIDMGTGIVRVYNPKHELVWEDSIADAECLNG